MEYTSEQLAEKFAKLPEDIKAAVWDLDLEGAIGEIGFKHHLRIDQIGILADQVALTMIGINPLDQLKNNFQRELNLPMETVDLLLADINQQIFLPIRDSLRQLHEREVAASPPSGETGKTIFDEKMAKLFRAPRAEINLTPPAAPPVKPAITDPYLEPIE